MALVEMMLEDGNAVAADLLLFQKGQTLTQMYPDRKLFHISEVRLWLALCCKIHIMHGNLPAARSLRDVLATMEPESPALNDLDRLLSPKNAILFQMVDALGRLADKAKSTSPRSRKTGGTQPTERRANRQGEEQS